MATDAFKTIACRGSAQTMGQQYGEAAREEIAQNLECRASPGSLAEKGAVLKAAHALLSDTHPDLYAELQGIAQGANADLDAVVYVNACSFGCGWPDECTSMIVRQTPSGAVLGKNNDGALDTPPFIIRTTQPDEGLPMIQVTYAGWLSGLDAMNAAGVVNSHNSVGSVFDKAGPKLDIRLQVYLAMQTCRTAADFIDQVTSASCTGKGYNILVTDKEGTTAGIEAAVPLTAVRDRNQDFIYATNHFVTPALKDADRRAPEAKPISIFRYGYLRWIAETRMPQCLEDVQGILRSTEPWAPCRHGGPQVSHTLWSMIGVPQEDKLLVASGPPDSHEYKAFDLGAL